MTLQQNKTWRVLSFMTKLYVQDVSFRSVTAANDLVRLEPVQDRLAHLGIGGCLGCDAEI
jgi:hypothetical protein